jgi:restriction endonuclease Mrr
VKHWSAPDRVGQGAIKRFAEVLMREQAAGGLFLSSSGYTNTAAAARLEVSCMPIMLGDSRKMLSFCHSFVLSEKGIWERDGNLTEVFFKDTFRL